MLFVPICWSLLRFNEHRPKLTPFFLWVPAVRVSQCHSFALDLFSVCVLCMFAQYSHHVLSRIRCTCTRFPEPAIPDCNRKTRVLSGPFLVCGLHWIYSDLTYKCVCLFLSWTAHGRFDSKVRKTWSNECARNPNLCYVWYSRVINLPRVDWDHSFVAMQMIVCFFWLSTGNLPQNSNLSLKFDW
jgi:hypothetical protein